MERISAELYRQARDWLIAHDPDGRPMYNWARSPARIPRTPEQLAAEIVWIILCAGRSAQAARTIEHKVWAAIRSGTPVVGAFGYRAKAAAIERAWRERERDFQTWQALPAGEPEALLAWCHAIPFIGDDTQYQLAKNLGADVAKPDIWLCRLSVIPDRPRRPVSERWRRCQALCEHLSAATGDGVAVVDSMLWLACNKGVLRVGSDAGAVEFRVGSAGAARPITPEALAAKSRSALSQLKLFDNS